MTSLRDRLLSLSGLFTQFRSPSRQPLGAGPSPVPRNRSAGRVGMAAAAALSLAVGGCGSDGPTEPTVDGLSVAEIILGEVDGVTFHYSHRDHWHGSLVVDRGGTSDYDIFFSEIQLPADDHDVPPVERWFTLADHPDYSIRVVVEDESLAEWTGTSIQGRLHGRVEGASRLSFVVLRGPTTVFESPPLNFRVRAPR